jgi:hypothetical protein
MYHERVTTNCKNEILNFLCLFVIPSVVVSTWNNWTSFYEIIFSIKSRVEEILQALRFDKYNSYFTCKPIYIYDNM